MTAHRDELGSRAELVLSCPDLDADLDFFTESLGFAVEAIIPADAPRTVRLVGYGLRICLQRGPKESPARLRIAGITGEPLRAPCGARVERVALDPPLALPAASPERRLVRMSEDSWGAGRAGMLYRDLIPGRQGGRFIASHIRVPGAGLVPDYVHFHKVRFQVIYCLRGSVRLVYEDQGPPFIMEAGDCVLQPPQIRHRVLESFDDLEVLELGCPAEHETWSDRELELPNGAHPSERRFSGQRFVFHRAERARWEPCELVGFTARDTGIAAATNRLARVRALRSEDGAEAALAHPGELHFLYGLEGRVRVGETELGPGDALTLEPGTATLAAEPKAVVLEVALPA